MRGCKWSDKQLEYLKENYPNISSSKIAKHLNIKINRVYNKASLLGLKKTDEYLKTDYSGRLNKINNPGKLFYFPKGHIPANKGQKMDAETYKKVSKTMFKKGNIPATTKYFGKPYLNTRIRKDGFKEQTWYIQLNNKRRRYLKYLCEINGIDLTNKKTRLKAGFNIIQEPTIKDIMIVTNQEHIKLNSLQRYPEDLRKLIYAKATLNRQINKLR